MSQKSYQNFSYTKLVSGWAIGPASHSPSRVNATAGELATWRAKRLFQQPWSFALLFFSEGVSKAEIGLDKVVVSQIWEVITKFAENRNIGSKAVFESAADMPEHLAATRKVVL